MARAHTEQRYVVELTEDEAFVLYSALDHLTDRLWGDTSKNFVYEQLTGVYGALSREDLTNEYEAEELGLPAPKPETDEDETE